MKKIVLLITILSIVAWFRPQSTAAQSPAQPEWVSWKLEVNFVKNDIIGEFTIILGYMDANDDPVELPINQPTMQVACKPYGNVTLAKGVATLAGGHVRCELPDLIDAANDIIANEFPEAQLFEIEPGECECVFMADKPVYADVTGELTGNTYAPVFHHPSIHFGLQPEGKAYVANRLVVDEHISQSPLQATRGTANFYSEYECSLPADVCKFRHYLEGHHAGTDSLRYKTPILDMSATTVYIGYDPTTTNTFEGELNQIIIDPPCHIDGFG